MPLQRVTLHAGNTRHTFMTIGAPASGKGTSSCIWPKTKPKPSGLQMSTIILKINTDHHRNIVSGPGELGKNKRVLFLRLNNDVASYITKRAYKRLETKLKDPKGPHIVIDGVLPETERLMSGVHNDGHLHLRIGTAPVDETMQRAYKRGKETGQFTTSSYLVQIHQNVSRDLYPQLIKLVGKNVEYKIYDMDIEHGEAPILIEEGNLHSKNVPNP